MNTLHNPEMPFQVPDQLKPLVDDTVLLAHEKWQQVTEAQLGEMLSQSERVVELGGQHQAKVAVVGEPEDGRTLVVGLPHQQTWKPPMGIRVGFLRDAIAPHSQVVVLPNNGSRSEYYTFSDSELDQLNTGDARPYAEMQARTLEALGVGEMAITGWSMGGFTGAAIGSVGSDKLNITHFNLDEMPMGSFGADEGVDAAKAELQKMFKNSGGPFDQLRAIADSNIPVLSRVYSPGRLAVDYVRFGLAMRNPVNKAMHSAMAGGCVPVTHEALAQYPNATFKFGHVKGSLLFDPNCAQQFEGENVRTEQYSGLAARRHTTGDNPVAHALSAKSGLQGW